MIDLLEAGDILEKIIERKSEAAKRKFESCGDRRGYQAELSRLMGQHVKVAEVSDKGMLDLILRLIREETGSSVASTDNGRALH